MHLFVIESPLQVRIERGDFPLAIAYLIRSSRLLCRMGLFGFTKLMTNRRTKNVYWIA